MYIQLENSLNEIFELEKLNFLMFLGSPVASFDHFRLKYFDLFSHYGHIFLLFFVLLVLADILKFTESKTTQNLCCWHISGWFDWLRSKYFSKSGMNILKNWSQWPCFLISMHYFGTSRWPKGYRFQNFQILLLQNHFNVMKWAQKEKFYQIGQKYFDPFKLYGHVFPIFCNFFGTSR